jgi:hypothetical protein
VATRWSIRTVAVLVVGLALGAGILVERAPAPVPPKNCGMLDVRGSSFNVKADQLRCRTARRYAKAYLGRPRSEPSGYRCRDYGPETQIEFRCARGDKVLFAIRR